MIFWWESGGMAVRQPASVVLTNRETRSCQKKRLPGEGRRVEYSGGSDHECEPVGEGGPHTQSVFVKVVKYRNNPKVVLAAALRWSQRMEPFPPHASAC